MTYKHVYQKACTNMFEYTLKTWFNCSETRDTGSIIFLLLSWINLSRQWLQLQLQSLHCFSQNHCIHRVQHFNNCINTVWWLYCGVYLSVLCSFEKLGSVVLDSSPNSEKGAVIQPAFSSDLIPCRRLSLADPLLRWLWPKTTQAHTHTHRLQDLDTDLCVCVCVRICIHRLKLGQDQSFLCGEQTWGQASVVSSPHSYFTSYTHREPTAIKFKLESELLQEAERSLPGSEAVLFLVYEGAVDIKTQLRGAPIGDFFFYSLLLFMYLVLVCYTDHWSTGLKTYYAKDCWVA